MFNICHVLFALLCFDKVLYSHTESVTSSKIPDAVTSCSNGWFPLGDMCYKSGGDKDLPKEEASERCREDYQGELAAIPSKVVEDFLIAFILLNVKDNMWIGLNDQANESVYTWEDGTPASYFNWQPTEPKANRDEKEDCVVMIFVSTYPDGVTGQWNNCLCSFHNYFICQKKKGIFNKNYLDPRKCPSEVGGGWKKNASCYNFIEEERAWSDAEEYCIQKFNGHLVSITDFTDDLFLNYILETQEKNIWIGIRTKNQFQQQWSSGWYVSYENWAEGQTPAEFDKEACVARDHEGKWVIRPCNKELPFICEYSTEKPPILKPTFEGSYCPDYPAGWRDLGGDFCYYFDLQNIVTWYKANFLCLKRDGTLLSIHSKEESESLQKFLKFMVPKVHRSEYFKHHTVYIGLFRHIQNDEQFIWADGSSLNFTNWQVNEPSTESEQCVWMKSDDMKWNDIVCSETRGFVCSVPKVSSNQKFTTNQTIVHLDPCLSGYSANFLAVVIVCILFVSVFVAVIAFYFFLYCEKNILFNKVELHDKKLRNRSESVVNEDGMYADEI